MSPQSPSVPYFLLYSNKYTNFTYTVAQNEGKFPRKVLIIGMCTNENAIKQKRHPLGDRQPVSRRGCSPPYGLVDKRCPVLYTSNVLANVKISIPILRVER